MLHNRSNPDCIQRNDLFCPGWAIDNLDRYVDPTVQHVVLVVASVGSASRSPSRWPCSRTASWPRRPFLAATGVLYTIPSIAFFFLLLPITGRGRTTAIIALTAFTLQIIYRNILDRAHTTCRRTSGRRPRHGPDRSGSCSGGSSCRWRCRRSSPGCGSRPSARSRSRPWRSSSTAAGSATEIYTAGRLTFKTGIILAGGLAIAMALVFDFALVTFQRYATPWRRAVPT